MFEVTWIDAAGERCVRDFERELDALRFYMLCTRYGLRAAFCRKCVVH